MPREIEPIKFFDPDDYENLSKKDKDFIDYFRNLFPADNKFGFDLSKVEMTEEELRETARKRDEIDVTLKKFRGGVILLEKAV